MPTDTATMTHLARAHEINADALALAERNAAEFHPGEEATFSAYARRHVAAFETPTTRNEYTTREGIAGKAMTHAIRSWLLYADAHHAMYGSGVGDDGVLGPAWARIGFALRELLNGELGPLDGGTCDRILAAALRAEGYDPDTEERIREAHRNPDPEDDERRLYRIVRMYRDDDHPREIIETGLTLEEARAHCRREDTHGEGWFDGYEVD